MTLTFVPPPVLVAPPLTPLLVFPPPLMGSVSVDLLVRSDALVLAESGASMLAEARPRVESTASEPFVAVPDSAGSLGVDALAPFASVEGVSFP